MLEDMPPDFREALDRRELDGVNIGLTRGEVDLLLAGEVLRYAVRDVETDRPSSIVFVRLKG